MRFIQILALSVLLFSCTEETYIPKPPTYLRLELPDHNYKTFSDSACPYSFSINEIFTVKKVNNGEGTSCHKDIDLGGLNGIMHLSYIDMEEPLGTYVNFVNDKVDEHKIMATGIKDKNTVDSERKVYGTFFELLGDVASPFQFYLTDSTDRFVSGVVYFNCTPNYDSLKPSLDYLKRDLEQMIEDFKWVD